MGAAVAGPALGPQNFLFGRLKAAHYSCDSFHGALLLSECDMPKQAHPRRAMLINRVHYDG